MNPLNIDQLNAFIDENLSSFYQNLITILKAVTLDDLLAAHNPYVLSLAAPATADALIQRLLDTYVSASEEKHFGDFLEALAVFVAGQTCGGHKSTAQGVDLEFINDNVHYVVSIKSGPNWGNSAQGAKLIQDLKTALMRVQQSKTAAFARSVLGICYGKTRTNFNYRFPGCWKVVGQNFWYLISENEALYTDIVEPIGYRAKQHNEAFDLERAKVVNRFSKKFIDRFCDPSGAINWPSLVAFNSGNYDLGQMEGG